MHYSKNHACRKRQQVRMCEYGCDGPQEKGDRHTDMEKTEAARRCSPSMQQHEFALVTWSETCGHHTTVRDIVSTPWTTKMFMVARMP